jgi:hypothetical protein
MLKPLNNLLQLIASTNKLRPLLLGFGVIPLFVEMVICSILIPNFLNSIENQYFHHLFKASPFKIERAVNIHKPFATMLMLGVGCGQA